MASSTELAVNGASTMNARTATESTVADANLMSLLTGRRVFPKRGGHSIGSTKKLPSTVHAGAGQYVSSIFDLAHNTSRRTNFVASRPQAGLVHESYNKRSGGKDPYGVDDGTAKIDQVKLLRDDAAAVTWWKQKVGSRAPHLSVIELSGVLDEGVSGGFTGDGYQRAVRKLSRRVAAIRRGISSQAEMQGTTLLVVTGTGGAQKSPARRAPGPRAIACRCGSPDPACRPAATSTASTPRSRRPARTRWATPVPSRSASATSPTW